MRSISFAAFADVLTKEATSASKLLAAMAKKRGISPMSVPAIKQVENIASRDRGRAAEVARNVKKYLKSQKAA